MSKTQHDGDCTIYAADHGAPTDGICTCGYGLQLLRQDDATQISKKEQTMTNNIPGVPEGWRLVRIGTPEIEEWFINEVGEPEQCLFEVACVYAIIERIPPAWQPPEYPDACKLPWVAGIACDRFGWMLYGQPSTYGDCWCGGEYCHEIGWLGLPPVPEKHWPDSWVPNPCYDPQAKWTE